VRYLRRGHDGSWYIEGHGYRGVWGYGNPVACWNGWRRLNGLENGWLLALLSFSVVSTAVTWPACIIMAVCARDWVLAAGPLLPTSVAVLYFRSRKRWL
jgi:hypothetical protein